MLIDFNKSREITLPGMNNVHIGIVETLLLLLVYMIEHILQLAPRDYPVLPEQDI